MMECGFKTLTDQVLPGAITVGEKFLLKCSVSGIDLTPESKVLLSNMSQVKTYELVLVDAPKIIGNVIEQTATSYRVGKHEFANIKLSIDGKDYLVSKQNLEVASVMKAEPSATPAPEGADPQQSAVKQPTPYPAYDPMSVKAPLWWWIMWGCIVLLIVAFIAREVKKYLAARKKINDISINTQRILSPQEKFFTNLRKLDSKGLYHKGEYKQFALELTQILKTGLSDRFAFNAEDMTSEEIHSYLEKRQKLFFLEAGVGVQWVLSKLDEIKFAKVETTAENCMALVDQTNKIGQILFKGESL